MSQCKVSRDDLSHADNVGVGTVVTHQFKKKKFQKMKILGGLKEK